MVLMDFATRRHGDIERLDCRLEVETHDGTLRFRLDGDRLNGKVMNKFHVNVPEASRPEKVFRHHRWSRRRSKADYQPER